MKADVARAARETRELRSKLLRPYRAKRETERPDAPGVFEDPAPPWVPAVVDSIIRYARSTTEVGEIAFEALRWCEQGDAPSRAERLLTVLANWPGDRIEAARGFLYEARKTDYGPAAGSKPKGPRVVRVQRSYDDPLPKDAKVLRRVANALCVFVEKEVQKLETREGGDLHEVNMASDIETGLRYALGDDVRGRIPRAVADVIVDAYGVGDRALVIATFERAPRGKS